MAMVVNKAPNILVCEYAAAVLNLAITKIQISRTCHRTVRR